MYEHTHHIQTRSTTSISTSTQDHILPTRSTTPHPSAITPHRIFICNYRHGRSPLKSTHDAALICLVAQVVVSWPVPTILLFFLVTRFLFHTSCPGASSRRYFAITTGRWKDVFRHLRDLHLHQPMPVFTANRGQSTFSLSYFPFFLHAWAALPFRSFVVHKFPPIIRSYRSKSGHRANHEFDRQTTPVRKRTPLKRVRIA